jgi:hypothetical protein
MLDKSHFVDSLLLSNSTEGVLVVEPDMVNDPTNDQDVINVNGNGDVRVNTNDDVVIVNNVVNLRQPLGPTGMINDILRQVPVVEDRTSTVMIGDVVRPNEPAEVVEDQSLATKMDNVVQPNEAAEMLKELVEPLAYESEIVLVQPDLSIPVTEQDREKRLASLAIIMKALLMEQTNLLNLKQAATESVSPIRTVFGNNTIEIDDDDDSKPSAVITPNQNKTDITNETQETNEDEYDCKPAAIGTIDEVENNSQDNITEVVKVTKNKKKKHVIETTQEDDDEDLGIGTEVTLPFLDDGYDWIQLDPPDIYNEVVHEEDPKELPHDLCHQSNATTETHARNYCLFLNETPEPAAITNYKSLITRMKKDYQEYIFELIYKFWFDIANKLEMNRGGEEIRDTRQLHMSIARFRSIDDCRKVLIMMYIVFDFLHDYHDKIKRMVEKNLTLRSYHHQQLMVNAEHLIS